jgi:hypothetical protein
MFAAFRISTCLMACLFSMCGCASMQDINEGFRRVDRMWLAEYQKTEDLYRYRIVDAEYCIVFPLVKRVFNDLGAAVQSSSLEDGIISGTCDAPTPLSKEEWKRVVDAENDRVKEVGGWMFYLPVDPKGYIVKGQATVKPMGSKTYILLDYRLDMPKFKSMGFQPSQYAPSLAVQLAAMKFWERLGELLEGERMPRPRLRTEEEKEKPGSPPQIASPKSPQKEARLMEANVFRLPPWTKLDESLMRTPSNNVLELDKLFRKTSKTVWMVISEKADSHMQPTSGSLGSAVAISQRLLLTNCHVVSGGQSTRLIQGEARIGATVVSADEHTDRCVLSADTDLIDFVGGIRDFKTLQVGEKVYTIGSPSGLERTLGDGIVSGLRTTESMRFIQTTAPISPGSSGGGLFDRAGNLIGITTFLFKEGQNLNFAIAASDYLRD